MALYGKDAKDAQLDRLAYAKFKSGIHVSPEDVWKTQGWQPQHGGKWKFEGGGTKEDIARNYPNLAGMTEVNETIPDTALGTPRGMYNPDTKVMQINSDFDQATQKKTRDHENQHAITGEETWLYDPEDIPTGNDWLDKQVYTRQRDEVEARNVANRGLLTPEQRKNQTPSSTQDIKFNGQLVGSPSIAQSLALMRGAPQNETNLAYISELEKQQQQATALRNRHKGPVINMQSDITGETE
jgi:hypothetical protein